MAKSADFHWFFLKQKELKEGKKHWQELQK